ncbi:MAG: glutamine amidotransferase family protein [Coriobacteriia bacterium]|nr:glutamine amidotransferase family protein [Coriobacteriia bacterium]
MTLLREGEVRIPAGCAISGIMDRSGGRHDGTDVLKSISLMHDRGNGLGGGFAAYGIYPDYKDLFAFHMLYETKDARLMAEAYLDEWFLIEKQEKIPTDYVRTIQNPPHIWRYFMVPHPIKLAESELDEAEYTMQRVFHINSHIDGAFVASSGKNMGAFKGVGYPEEIGEFYRIQDYKAWLWTAHNRFPTNTPGWWGGAHPFTLLNWSIVHNGEISSYDANRRYVEQFGYNCDLQTDTEVITYLFDLLIRRHGLSAETAAHIMTAPSWEEIDRMEPGLAAYESALRTVYSSALINGPFSVILGSEEGLLALNDRLKLRALMVAEKGDMVYLASEQAAIEVICPDAENMRSVEGGVPFVVELNEVAERKRREGVGTNVPVVEVPGAAITEVAATRTYQRGV